VARALALPTRGESTATGHFNRGVALAARAKEVGDPERLLALAESELREAVSAEDRYAPLFVELGKVLARRDRNDDAIQVYLQAAALEPSNYRIHHALGLLHRRVGDLPRAAAAFRRSVELEPRFAPSAVELGSLLLADERAAEAIPWFEHALSVAPTNRDAADGLREARAASEP
jgi:tetratricopeptide (TPR) repeat protein